MRKRGEEGEEDLNTERIEYNRENIFKKKR